MYTYIQAQHKDVTLITSVTERNEEVRRLVNTKRSKNKVHGEGGGEGKGRVTKKVVAINVGAHTHNISVTIDTYT